MPIAYLLFFISGATGLVYEVVWLRQLTLVFGSTLYATSAILSTFMGGLALGAYVGGRWIDRHPARPLSVYGILELVLGAYALAVPGLLAALSPLYKAVWDAGASDSFVLLGIVKFVGIALVLVPATALMGATLPVLSRYVHTEADRLGGTVGALYAVNTFGAVAGTALAGFLLLPALGMTATTRTVASVNFALGITAWVVDRRRRGRVSASAPSRTEGLPQRTPKRSLEERVAIVAFALSGFAAMVLEVAWTRGLSLTIGSSVYAFASMLIVFLAGLAAGSAVTAVLLRRRPETRTVPLLAFLLAGAGVLSAGTGWTLQQMPRLFGEIYFRWNPDPSWWLLVQFALAVLVMFPPTLLIGGIFPVVLQIHSRGSGAVGGTVGSVYAANTAGTIAGAALAGFLFVPWLGLRDTLLFTSILQVVLGAALVSTATGIGRSARRAWTVGAAVTIAALVGLAPAWDVQLMNSGVYMNVQDTSRKDGWAGFMRRVRVNNEPVFVKDGHTATVMVARQPASGNLYLAVNGKTDASSREDLETQIALGHLPVLLHPSPKDVLLVGLASGITAGSVATHPIASLRVVEVEASMRDAARLFAEHNGAVLDDPRFTLSINDARNEIQFNPADYDVIISEPSNPWLTVASNLFTEDFFRIAKGRLRPGGVFGQWIQAYCLHPRDLASVLAAFRAAFPHVLVFDAMDGTDLLLMGTDDPLRIDLRRLGERMAELRVRLDLGRIAIRKPEDWLLLLRAGDAGVDSAIRGARRNTDDNGQVEFSAPKALYAETHDANIRLLTGGPASEDLLSFLTPPPSAEDRDRLWTYLAERWVARGQKDRAADALEHIVTPQARDRIRAILK